MLKLWFWLFLIGAMNFLRDILEHPQTHDSLRMNIVEASFVAFPFSVFALALVGHMQKLQRQLADLAATDQLTGLPNRRVFLECLDAMRSRADAVLLMIDVDHFKRVNDTYGHGVGDQCLKAMADHLRAVAGPSDIIARLGGEEFGMVLVGYGQSELDNDGMHIAAGISQTVGADQSTQTITNSVGAVRWRTKTAVSELMRQADTALYAAKAAGRAQMIMADDVPLLAHNAPSMIAG